MAESFIIVRDKTCEEAHELLQFLFDCIAQDGRGHSIARVTAVQIDHKYVHIELREFADGTREYALKGV